MKHLLTICMVAAFILTLGSTTMAVTWNVPGDFGTIQEAIDSPDVSPGATILVSAGNRAGALVTKEVEIKGEGGAVIVSGPAHSSGLSQGFRLISGSDGATISHLGFTTDLSIMNGAAVSDVTVDHCTFTNSVQAISNWAGNGWQISHNVINDLHTRCGGGIGILVAGYTDGTVRDNTISHNKITGTMHISPGDCGNYNGSGIVLYADYRYGATGAIEISNNRVVKNKISLVAQEDPIPPENPIDVVAFELTDTRDDINADPYPVVTNNVIGFNDFRGTVLQIALTPSDLENHNSLSRNLGDNRGHGLHPSVFGPGGN
ncbi:MAG: right-handed parallel beta-helix repeat-containing protein [Planctomycetota bacterium]|jgi:hypothetical protein